MSTPLSSTPESFEAVSFSYAAWRERFLTIILRGASVVGLIVAIAGSIDTSPILVAVYTISYLTLLAVTVIPLPYRVRAVGFLAVMMALVIASLLETGIRVDARLFLLAFVVMAAMFFGPRAGVIAAGLSFIPVFIIGYFVLTSQYTLLSKTILGSTNVLTWLVAMLVLVLIETMILTGLTLLQNGFNTALQQSQRLFEVVLAERASLETRVEARTVQIKASAGIGRAAAEHLEVDRLLQRVVNLITERFDYYAAIFLIDATGQHVVLREATGEPGQALKERRQAVDVDEKSLVGSAAAQRQVRLVSNLGDAQRTTYFNNPLLPLAKAEIALPLIADGQVLGVLDVQSKYENAFDETSADALQAIADQIAIALNNADRFHREQARAQQNAALVDASNTLSGLTDRMKLQEQIITLATQLLQADGAGLWLPASNNEIELKVTNNVDLIGAVGRRIKVGEGLSGRVYAAGAALRVGDYSNWIGHAAAFADAPMRAALAVPLILRGKVAGVLLLAYAQPNAAFTAEDEKLAQLFTVQAASAIEIADLLEQQRRTLEELDEANRRLTGEAWTQYVQQLASGFQRQTYYAQGGSLAAPTLALPEIERAMDTRQPAVWVQPADAPAESSHLSGLAAPIVLRGEVLGALQVGEAQQTREWTADDQQFIQAIADQVALALDNARLIEETERRAQREKTVAEISSKMFSQNDLEAIVEIAAGELGRVLRLSRAEVRIGAEALTAATPHAERAAGRGNGQEEEALS